MTPVVDVQAETLIRRPVHDVAAFAGDPRERSGVVRQHPQRRVADAPPVAVGSGTADGPFPMETTYTWEPAGEGATRMTLSNRARPSGFASVAAPAMAAAMKRATTADLARLARLLEGA
jgi:hypothetical protein